MTIKPTGCGLDDYSRRGNIYLKYFLSSSRVRRWVMLLNTPYLQYSAESGKRSVLTLGLLCLSCCVRDTAWSWFILFKASIIFVHYYILNFWSSFCIFPPSSEGIVWWVAELNAALCLDTRSKKWKYKCK